MYNQRINYYLRLFKFFNKIARKSINQLMSLKTRAKNFRSQIFLSKKISFFLNPTFLSLVYTCLLRIFFSLIFHFHHFTLNFFSEKPFKFQNLFSPDIRFAEAPTSLLPNNPSMNQSNNLTTNADKTSNLSKQISDQSSKQSNPSVSQSLQTPLINPKQIVQQTPQTIISSNQIQSNNPNIHKQLKYEDSPSSMLINQSCDLASFKYAKKIKKLLFLNIFISKIIVNIFKFQVNLFKNPKKNFKIFNFLTLNNVKS